MYQRLDVSFISADGEIRLGSVESPQSNTPSIALPTGPAPGNYTLRVTGVRRDGTSPQLNATVTIVP